VIGPYVVVNGLASLWTAKREWRTLSWLPLTFLTLHLAYGLGFLQGLGAFTVRFLSFVQPR
jgi:hypothetical protein